MFKKVSFLILTFAIMITGAIAISPHVIMAQPTSDEETTPTNRIGISPAKDHVKLKPNDHYKGSFTINNTGTKSFDFDVYVKPYAVTDECIDNYDNDNSFTQMSRWVKFKKTNFKLQPGEEQIVEYTIDVPSDAPSGGQYIVIFAETMGDDSEQDGMVKTSRRIGIKIYGDLGGENRKSGKVISVAQKQLFWTPPISGSSKVSNNGNVDFAETHTYTVTGLSGQEVYTNSQQLDILPDTCRQIKHEWQKTPGFGIFWVENKIEFLGKVQFSAKKLVVVLPIYVIVLFFIVAALLIWAFVLRIRGNGAKFGTKTGRKKLSKNK